MIKVFFGFCVRRQRRRFAALNVFALLIGMLNHFLCVCAQLLLLLLLYTFSVCVSAMQSRSNGKFVVFMAQQSQAKTQIKWLRKNR